MNFRERFIRLDPGETKNDESRVVPIREELYSELKAQRKLRDKRFPFGSKVFFNHVTGKPIRDFRGAWDSARKKAKLPDALFHDFRRTGVRNLTQAGVPEKVAMHISGHRTRSVSTVTTLWMSRMCGRRARLSKPIVPDIFDAEFFGVLLSAPIWLGYLLHSKRVKATFVRKPRL